MFTSKIDIDKILAVEVRQEVKTHEVSPAGGAIVCPSLSIHIDIETAQVLSAGLAGEGSEVGCGLTRRKYEDSFCEGQQRLHSRSKMSPPCKRDYEI